MIVPKIITNAFSLNMIYGFPAIFTVVEVSIEQAAEYASYANSYVGHKDTAVVFSNILGVQILENRSSFLLDRGEGLLVGQYTGPRLPEGATKLPQGASIHWLVVSLFSSIVQD